MLYPIAITVGSERFGFRGNLFEFFAEHTASRGVPGDLVMEWVGHSSLRTTARYTHFRDDYRHQVATEVGLFSNGPAESELRVGPNGTKSERFALQDDAA
jgi:hypothetical protein